MTNFTVTYTLVNGTKITKSEEIKNPKLAVEYALIEGEKIDILSSPGEEVTSFDIHFEFKFEDMLFTTN